MVITFNLLNIYNFNYYTICGLILQTIDRHIIFSVYHIWWASNFLLFSENMI